jgi:hypothetical protein
VSLSVVLVVECGRGGTNPPTTLPPAPQDTWFFYPVAELGLSPPEDEKPPPVREVVFLPVDDEGREIQVG